MHVQLILKAYHLICMTERSASRSITRKYKHQSAFSYIQNTLTLMEENVYGTACLTTADINSN